MLYRVFINLIVNCIQTLTSYKGKQIKIIATYEAAGTIIGMNLYFYLTK